jgi:signal transduction histidine kinase
MAQPEAGSEKRARVPLLSPSRWPVRWRIAGVSAGLTLLILVVFALVVGRLATDRVKDDFHQELESAASQLRGQLAGINTPGGQNVLRLLQAGDAAARVVTPEGQVVLDAAGQPMKTANAPELGAPDVNSVRSVGDFDVVSVPTVSSTGAPQYIQYARQRDSLEATLSKLWLFLAGGVIGGTILAALAGLWVADRAMRPISSLTAAAREIATTRDPSQRIPKPENDDEVAELARTLDEMLRALDAARSETEQMIQAQRDFVADASHELRTPLTSILANLELLEASLAERGADPEEEEIVAGALGSSRRMRRLVADLLLLARADAGRAGPRRTCDLREIAAAAVSEVRPVAVGHELELETPAAVTVDGNPDDLHRLVLNLVENGVHHTPAGTTVTVSVSSRADAAVIEVTDDGPGLPDKVGEQIFSRFVRGNGPADRNNNNNAGTGLGLAIVKAVAASHGGRVESGSSASGGARFTVLLPLAEPAPALSAII